ncbi:porin [Burkholderia cepacia]|uniref:porin n=1 Tax=Burkholderia cepacia TaxID=292 RepID=UPI0007559DCA|nr:porin [Burkholderia cepacia]KWC91766.1 porin [Burkholderia cepacia]
MANKHHVGSVAVVLLATGGVVHAQGSVTLYGIVDEGITYSSNQHGKANVQLQSGKLGGSRWGFRGSEDLGNGIKAIFNLENGFNATNGTFTAAGREFGRAAYVGLSKQGLGALTLGRQTDVFADLVAQYFGSGFWTPSTHIGDSDDMNQYFRINNSVKFLSDSFYGVRVAGIYGFSNAAGNFANNRAWSLAANYSNGPFSIGGGFMELNQPNSTTNTSGALGGASTSNGDDYSTALFYGLDGGVRRQRVTAAGAGYTYGAAQMGFGFSHVQLDYVDGASRKLNNFDVNLRYRISAPLSVIAVYTYTDGSADNIPKAAGHLSPRWHQATLGIDYLLSKRTELYASAEYQRALGDASIKSGNSLAAIAYIPSAGAASSTGSQVAVSVGVRHKF